MEEEGPAEVRGKTVEGMSMAHILPTASSKLLHAPYVASMVDECSVNDHCDKASLHGFFNNDKTISWQIRPPTIYKYGDLSIQFLMFAKSKHCHKLIVEKITIFLWQWSERARNIVGHIWEGEHKFFAQTTNCTSHYYLCCPIVHTKCNNRIRPRLESLIGK
jgi:hypothetical protein